MAENEINGCLSKKMESRRFGLVTVHTVTFGNGLTDVIFELDKQLMSAFDVPEDERTFEQYRFVNYGGVAFTPEVAEEMFEFLSKFFRKEKRSE